MNLVAQIIKVIKLLIYINISPYHPTFYDWQKHLAIVIRVLQNAL